jgi:S1-C subfamily serine protease
MKRFLILLIAIFTFACCGHTNDFESTTPQTVHRSVGKLTAYRYMVVEGEVQQVSIDGGTGFAISKNEIMTANHVCKSLDFPGTVIRLSFYNGIYEVSFDNSLIPIKRDSSKDLCILFMRNNPLKPIKFSNTWPKMGDEIFVFGAPGHEAYILTSGHYGQNMFIEISDNIEGMRAAVISAPVFPGNSGSPILNEKGEFIGVLVAGYLSYHHLGYTPSFLSVRDFLEGR